MGGIAGAPDWMKGALVPPKKALDSLLEIQCQLLKTASAGSETLASELKELQQAKDPMQFMSAQMSVANQQMEAFTSQVASVMQQLYDAQLLWLGQWDHKAEELQLSAAQSQGPAQQGPSALSALGRMQDEWLKATQSWVDSINAGTRSH
jgi:hypothetical protein